MSDGKLLKRIVGGELVHQLIDYLKFPSDREIFRWSDPFSQTNGMDKLKVKKNSLVGKLFFKPAMQELKLAPVIDVSESSVTTTSEMDSGSKYSLGNNQVVKPYQIFRNPDLA